MELKNVKKVGIIGCGAMGPTIAAMVALKYPVVVKEVNKKLADKGFQSISECFPALVRRNVITEVQKEVALTQITMTTELKDLKDCQVIIDAVPDILELKTANFTELNKICSSDTVFTTTSSMLSITALAAGSGRPDRTLGTHYNYPAHLMALVEVAPAIQTSQETLDFVMAFLKEGLGKTPVKCKDSPGYIVNYVFFPFLVRAVNAVEQGLGTVDEVDTAIRLGLAHRNGPFQLMDMFGVDSVVSACRVLYEQFHDERYAAPPLLVKMAEAGHLGRKVGHGWYTYDGQGNQTGVTKIA